MVAGAITSIESVLGTVMIGECTKALARLPEACVDAVFADPPYNL